MDRSGSARGGSDRGHRDRHVRQSAAAAPTNATSVGSPRSLLPAAASSALLHATITPVRWCSGPGSITRVSCPGMHSPPVVQILTTCMRLSVSVPVVSVQFTSIEPRASTALNRLITAPRRTRPRAPRANASVMTGSRPSGTRPGDQPHGEDHRRGRRQARAECREQQEGTGHHDRDRVDRTLSGQDVTTEDVMDTRPRTTAASVVVGTGGDG